MPSAVEVRNAGSRRPRAANGGANGTPQRTTRTRYPAHSMSEPHAITLCLMRLRSGDQEAMHEMLPWSMPSCARWPAT